MFAKRKVYKAIKNDMNMHRNKSQDIHQLKFIKNIQVLFPYGENSNFWFHIYNRPNPLNSILPGALLTGKKVAPDIKELSFKFYANCEHIINVRHSLSEPIYFIAELIKFINPYYLLRIISQGDEDLYLFALHKKVINELIGTYLNKFSEHSNIIKQVSVLNISSFNSLPIMKKPGVFGADPSSELY